MLEEQIKEEIDFLQLQINERAKENQKDKKKLNALKRTLKTLNE